MEFLYEHIISNSETYLGVPNIDVQYYFNLSFDNFSMMVSSDKINNPEQYIDISKLPETNDGYGCFQVSDPINTVRIINGNCLLNPREIRYIKYSSPQLQLRIAKILYTIVNQFFHIKCHNAEIQYNSDSKMIVYNGNYNKAIVIKTSTDISEKILAKMEKMI